MTTIQQGMNLIIMYSMYIVYYSSINMVNIHNFSNEDEQ